MLSPAVLSPVLARHDVSVRGNPGGRPLVFAHGFGCDQTMWRHVAPAFEEDHLVVAFDHAGAGGSDPAAFRPERYPTLHAYARDVLEILRALELEDVTLVGHSVSAMIGVLAAIEEPERFASLVLVAPSPRYLDDDGYHGGFAREDVDGLLETMDMDYLGWSATMAPMIMGNAGRPALGEELTASFCRTDPAAARHFAAVTFLSDNRADLPLLRVPSLILQCRDDVIAPAAVGDYLHAHLRDSELVHLDATGHCPNISAPAETTAAIRAYVGR